MGYETIRVGVDARGVAELVLSRPDKHNAMDARMIGEMSEAAQALDGDAAVRVVVLSGAGKTFCAGGDLGWMRNQAGRDRAGRMAEARTLAAMLGRWDALSKPVIGRVHGAAYGGGLGLIAVCDVVVAAADCRFALTETRLGLIPATIGPFVVRRLGEAFARQVFFTARPFGTDFLIRAGMVSRACPIEGLDAAVAEEVAAVLDCAPGAVAAAKALCRKLAGSAATDWAEATAETLADRWESDEARLGIEAFFAKGVPPWRSPE